MTTTYRDTVPAAAHTAPADIDAPGEVERTLTHARPTCPPCTGDCDQGRACVHAFAPALTDAERELANRDLDLVTRVISWCLYALLAVIVGGALLERYGPQILDAALGVIR